MKWLKQLLCSHRFDYADLIGRTSLDGNVTWPCWKCKKVFTASYGLRILWHGKVEPKQKL
jgi:hypothetical protein